MSAQGYWATATAFLSGAALSAIIVLFAWWNAPSTSMRPKLDARLAWSILAAIAGWLVSGVLCILALTGSLA